MLIITIIKQLSIPRIYFVKATLSYENLKNLVLQMNNEEKKFFFTSTECIICNGNCRDYLFVTQTVRKDSNFKRRSTI